MSSRINRLADNWVYGAALLAPILLLLTPFVSLESAAAAWVWVALCAYIVHQYEEHDADRFRAFVNALIPEGRAGLQPFDVLAINFLGVWVWLAITFVLTLEVDKGWASLALYLLAINGFVHVLQAVGLRRYNPGLITSVVLFFPLSAVIWMVSTPSFVQHLVGIVAVLALHVAILVYALRKVPAIDEEHHEEN
ncbi:MAG: HXXEE domain-containing protein [Pseudomonadota bacterium]